MDVKWQKKGTDHGRVIVCKGFRSGRPEYLVGSERSASVVSVPIPAKNRAAS